MPSPGGIPNSPGFLEPFGPRPPAAPPRLGSWGWRSPGRSSGRIAPTKKGATAPSECSPNHVRQLEGVKRRQQRGFCTRPVHIHKSNHFEQKNTHPHTHTHIRWGKKNRLKAQFRAPNKKANHRSEAHRPEALPRTVGRRVDRLIQLRGVPRQVAVAVSHLSPVLKNKLEKVGWKETRSHHRPTVGGLWLATAMDSIHSYGFNSRVSIADAVFVLLFASFFLCGVEGGCWTCARRLLGSWWGPLLADWRSWWGQSRRMQTQTAN